MNTSKADFQSLEITTSMADFSKLANGREHAI
jgi:hypothetical protein